MHKYETFGNKIQKFDHDEQCLRHGEGLRCSVAEGRGVGLVLGLVAVRQPFTAAKDFATVRGAPRCDEGACDAQFFWFFPFCDFSPKSSKTQTKTWESLPMTSKYHPKLTMSKTYGWIRVFLTQTSNTTF